MPHVFDVVATIEDRRLAREEKVESIVERQDARAWIATFQVPPAKAVEIPQGVRSPIASSRESRVLQEIEMMANEPDGACREKALEKVRTDFVMERTVDGLADVVEEGRGPEHAVIRRTMRELEDLQRVEERIAFRVVTR